jgi:(p)ppGpp synthase/HD superfamily hydrolase
MSENLVIRAMQDAHHFHRFQFRRCKPVGHITHVIRVTGRVMTLPDIKVPDVTATAWHDVGEDCAKDLASLETLFSLHEVRYGSESASIMRGLTKPSKFAKCSREQCLEMDMAHISKQPIRVMRIKAVDRIDNLGEWVLDLSMGYPEASPIAAMRYVEESELLSAILVGIDADLHAELRAAVADLRRVTTRLL